MTPNSLKTTPKSKEKEGKRGEKKRAPGTHDYYVANFGKKKKGKITRYTPLQMPWMRSIIFKNLAIYKLYVIFTKCKFALYELVIMANC